MKKILLTGAKGFIGKRYIEYNKTKYSIETFSISTTPISQANFSQVDTVVHLAGLAHQMQKTAPELYFKANYDLTKEFALAAKKAGVKHFIFISTIKAFGEENNVILDENTPCNPINDPYGESKLKAEIFLNTLNDSNFIVSIVRPPLVYGPFVKGNLIKLLELSNKNYPLPLAKINNQRTMVFLDNLIELINQITEKQMAGLFLAGDDRSMSTTELITLIKNNLDIKPKLFVAPKIFVNLFRLVKPSFVNRLYGSLEMDTSKTNKVLNFKPPYPIEKGIKTMVDWYKSSI